MFYCGTSIIFKKCHDEKLLGSKAMARVSHMAQLFVANQRR